MQNLLAAPRQDLTDAVVLDALRLDAPRVRHGVEILDGADHKVGDLAITDGSVTYGYRPPDRVVGQETNVAAVRLTASFTTVGVSTVDLSLNRYRAWTEWFAGTTGQWVRFHKGVFVAQRPKTADDGMVVTQQVTLADKTSLYAARTLDDALVVDAGTNPVAYVIDSLGAVFAEQVTAISGTAFTLADPMVFDAGTTWLAVYNALLDAAAFDDLWCDENGHPASTPLADLAGRGSELTYGPGAPGKILRAGSVDPLLSSIANQVKFVARQGPSLPEDGNGSTTRTNQSTGPASVDRRGVVAVTVTVDADDQDALEAIADADCQRYFAGGGLGFTGQVALNPLHSNRDTVTLLRPRLGLSGLFVVTGWSYPLKPIAAGDTPLMALTAEQRVQARPGV